MLEVKLNARVKVDTLAREGALSTVRADRVAVRVIISARSSQFYMRRILCEVRRGSRSRRRRIQARRHRPGEGTGSEFASETSTCLDGDKITKRSLLPTRSRSCLLFLSLLYHLSPALSNFYILSHSNNVSAGKRTSAP